MIRWRRVMNSHLVFRTALALSMGCAVAAAGDLTDRFQLTLDRVTKGGPPEYTEALVLADVIPRATRRFTEYSGDVSGRYVGAMATAAEKRDNAIGRCDHGRNSETAEAGRIFRTRFCGRYRHDEMALHGKWPVLIGMLEFQQRHPSPELLNSARRLGDFLIRIAPRMNDDELQRRVDQGDFAAAYICWTQQIEGLVELSRITGEPKYLDLARQIAARIRRIPAQHAHGFLTSLRGVVALYEATGEKQYLDQAIREWRGIVDSGNLLIQGAVPEALAPKIRRDEGCAEADWLRLSLALWRHTHQPEFLKQAELTLFNEYALNQFSTGDFGSRVLSPTGISTGIDADGAGAARCWWCCTLHGLRAFADIRSTVFRPDGGDLWYDLPADGRGQAGALALTAESALETRGSILLRVNRADAASHTLNIRVPDWADALEISINGTPDKAPTVNSYRKLERTWKAGDRIELKYAMHTRVAPAGQSGRYALFHGPWLLAADEQTSPFFWDEPDDGNRLRIAVEGGKTHLEPAPEPPGDSACPLRISVWSTCRKAIRYFRKR